VSTCYIVSPVTLTAGTYTWQVQTYNVGGYGPLSTTYTITGAKPPIRLAYFANPPSNPTAEMPILARKYSQFILTRTFESTRDRLRTLGVTQPFWRYIRMEVITDTQGCNIQPWQNQVADRIGDFCSINTNHPDWLLRDSQGRRIVLETPDPNQIEVAVDPGNQGFRQFFVQRTKEVQAQYRWDHVFLDNADGSLTRYQRMGITLAKYNTDAQFQAAVEGFLAYVYQNYTRPAGKLLYANMTQVNSPDVIFRYLKYLDGVMLETWSVDYEGIYLSALDWENDMKTAEKVQSLGKKIILVAQGSKTDTRRQLFTYASYLLINNGSASFRYTDYNSYNQVWPYSNYELPLGNPLGARYKVGTVWRRNYANGTVTVDPTTHIGTITMK
jgi:hypothetical protein